MDIEDTKHKGMNRFNNGWTVLEYTEQRKLTTRHVRWGYEVIEAYEEASQEE